MIAGPKKPEYEPQSDGSKIGYFVEECGEVLVPIAIRIGRVLAAVGKMIRWGPQGYNPEIPAEERETNAQWVLRELADLEAAIARLRKVIEKAPEPPA